MWKKVVGKSDRYRLVYGRGEDSRGEWRELGGVG